MKPEIRLKRRFFLFGMAFMLIPSFVSIVVLLGQGTEATFTTRSKPVDWTNEAIPMIKRYEKSRKNFKVRDVIDTTKLKTLNAVVFEANHFENLINYAPGKKAKYILLYFGIDSPSLKQNPLKSHPRYRIITVGADSANNKLFLIAKQAYDKADPCPPFCPDSIALR